MEKVGMEAVSSAAKKMSEVSAEAEGPGTRLHVHVACAALLLVMCMQNWTL
jgi:hypothetical protein